MLEGRKFFRFILQEPNALTDGTRRWASSLSWTKPGSLVRIFHRQLFTQFVLLPGPKRLVRPLNTNPTSYTPNPPPISLTIRLPPLQHNFHTSHLNTHQNNVPGPRVSNNVHPNTFSHHFRQALRIQRPRVSVLRPDNIQTAAKVIPTEYKPVTLNARLDSVGETAICEGETSALC